MCLELSNMFTVRKSGFHFFFFFFIPTLLHDLITNDVSSCSTRGIFQRLNASSLSLFGHSKPSSAASINFRSSRKVTQSAPNGSLNQHVSKAIMRNKRYSHRKKKTWKELRCFYLSRPFEKQVSLLAAFYVRERNFFSTFFLLRVASIQSHWKITSYVTQIYTSTTSNALALLVGR